MPSFCMQYVQVTWLGRGWVWREFGVLIHIQFFFFGNRGAALMILPTSCKLEPTRLVPRDAFGRLSLVPLDYISIIMIRFHIFSAVNDARVEY